MNATQLKSACLPKSVTTKRAARRGVRELLLDIAYALHATRVIGTLPARGRVTACSPAAQDQAEAMAAAPTEAL